MQELLEHILKNVVTNPDALEIKVSEEEGREVYTIAVDPEDMGRVIGKNGKVIKAIRALAHVVAIRQNKRFRINLADETGAPVENAEPQTEIEADAKVEPVEEVADVIDLSPETDEVEKLSEEAETEE
jgi:predicted RNA-binding protein YlqC (UPF0109 family)